VSQQPHNTIRTWALVATALTSGIVAGFGWWLIKILAAPDWCERAIGAADAAQARPDASVQACFGLLNKQVDALALNSHFAIGTLALCLAVLVVIVMAGGRLSFKASKSGIETEIGRDDGKVEGARRVEQAAHDERKAIEDEAKPIPATVDKSGQIVPDDGFEEATR
jgi:hypothetical protein